MPITIRRSGQVAAGLRAPAAPRVAAGPIDMTRTASAQLTQTVGQALTTMGKVAADQIRQDIEAKQATDVLNAANEYADATADFEDKFFTNVKGKEARDTAGTAFADFHKNELSKFAQQFDGNPQMKSAFLNRASTMRRSSLNRGLTYGRAEDLAYRQSTDKANYSRLMSTVAESSDADAMKAIDMYAAEHAAIFPNDHGATDSKGNRIEPEAITKARTEVVGTLINRAIAEKDYERASNLLNGNKKVLGATVDEYTARVERARVVDSKDNGVKLASDLYNQGMKPTEAWEKIGKIKDNDERSAAMSQYSSLQTMKMRIDTEEYQNAIPGMRQDIDSLASTDIAAAEAKILAMPEDTEVNRKKKDWGIKYVNQWKASAGIQPLTDSGSYLSVQADILGGKLNTPEAIRADPRAAKITSKDVEDDLVKLLGTSQKITDKAIDDACRSAFGAKKWDKIKKNNKDRHFSILKSVREMAISTNRAQDTGYIQSVVDTIAIEGEKKGGWGFGYGEDTTLADALATENVSFTELAKSFTGGTKSPWIADADMIPNEFKEEYTHMWPEDVKAAWEKIYGDDAMRGAYTQKMLQDIGKRNR